MNRLPGPRTGNMSGPTIVGLQLWLGEALFPSGATELRISDQCHKPHIGDDICSCSCDIWRC